VFEVDFPEIEDFDGSYPIRYKHADSIFFIMKKNTMPWIASVDESGRGLVHTLSRELSGRKIFAWGNNAGGKKWMNFLSEEGKGNYLEIQAGLRPTQLQTIPMQPRVGLEWTECVQGLTMDPKDAHHSEYKTACASMLN